MVDFINVSKKYDDQKESVFENFNLHVDRGEMVALTGSSGIGKTTLITLLLKEIEPSSGEILVDGKKLSKINYRKIPFYRRQIGVIFQDYRLVPGLTAYENVKLAMLAADTWSGKQSEMKRISSIFSMLGIAALHNKKPAQMSGGEQQKVCMARAIVNYPLLLLADEPTGNLDPKSSEEIFNLLKIINQQGITVILSTHDVERAEKLGCRNVKLCEANGFRGLEKRKEISEEDNNE